MMTFFIMGIMVVVIMGMIMGMMMIAQNNGLAFQLVEPGDGFVDRAGQWTHLWESKKKSTSTVHADYTRRI